MTCDSSFLVLISSQVKINAIAFNGYASSVDKEKCIDALGRLWPCRNQSHNGAHANQRVRPTYLLKRAGAEVGRMLTSVDERLREPSNMQNEPTKIVGDSDHVAEALSK